MPIGACCRYFQAIAQSASEAAIEKQVDVCCPAGTWGILTKISLTWVSSNWPLSGQDPHAAVFDEHVTLTLLTCGQPGWKASSASCTLKNRLMLRSVSSGLLAQRALVLEETLVHRTFENRGTQPFVERRAETSGRYLAV